MVINEKEILFVIGACVLIAAAYRAGQRGLGGSQIVQSTDPYASHTDVQGDPIGSYTNANLLGGLDSPEDESASGFLAEGVENVAGWMANRLNPLLPNPAMSVTGSVHDLNRPVSYVIQTSSNRPFNQGTNADYASAIDGGADPSYAASGLLVSDASI